MTKNRTVRFMMVMITTYYIIESNKININNSKVSLFSLILIS